MSETALSLKNFTLSLSHESILEDINLEIPRGGITLLSGARGSGKSALMRSFIHLNEEIFDDVHFTGSIKLFGENVAAIDRKKVRQQIAYVDTSFLEALANFTLLEFFRFLKGKKFKLENFADDELDLLSELGLLELLSLKVTTSLKLIPLSKRLSLLIFSTLARRPEVIMLDNVLDHLDDDACTEVKNILLDTRKNYTLIISSRFVSRLLDISDLLIVLKSGKIYYVGSPEVFVLQSP